jgi:hypothetical protein
MTVSHDVVAPRCLTCGTFYDPLINAGGNAEKIWFCYRCRHAEVIKPEELGLWQELQLLELRRFVAERTHD